MAAYPFNIDTSRATKIGAPPDIPRRGFLRGLASLPLIGGSVALLGQPSAVAEPVTEDLLYTYADWLFMERRVLFCELAGHDIKRAKAAEAVRGDRAELFHFPVSGDWRKIPQPSSRAALVLSTVGCDWRAA